MITHFIEASQGNQNWGKFMVAKLDGVELTTMSALPGYEFRPLFAGRGVNQRTTIVFDLQTAEGAGFLLGSRTCTIDLNTKHQIWVCPMFEPFLNWLDNYVADYVQREKDVYGPFLKDIPRYVEIPDAPFSFAGHRRERKDGERKTHT